MLDNEKNLTSDRYKTCGYGKPYYNQEGEYDEVICGYLNNQCEFCGDIECPLDK